MPTLDRLFSPGRGRFAGFGRCSVGRRFRSGLRGRFSGRFSRGFTGRLVYGSLPGCIRRRGGNRRRSGWLFFRCNVSRRLGLLQSGRLARSLCRFVRRGFGGHICGRLDGRRIVRRTWLAGRSLFPSTSPGWRGLGFLAGGRLLRHRRFGLRLRLRRRTFLRHRHLRL
ncbi:hypothetical protein GCM10023174_18140 [Chelativorans composti]